MKQRKTADRIILAGYAIPWAFLALYADWKEDTVLLYAAAFFCTLALGWVCGKTGRIPLGMAGNLLSAAVSCLCAWGLQQEAVGYFKPFSAPGWAAVLSLAFLMVQYLFWYPKTRKEPWQCLLAAVCISVLSVGGFLLILLLWSAVSIGAV